MFPIVSDNWELELPHGVQPVDGVDNARRAVREQVAHGADWIKYYSDRRYYFGPAPDSVLHSWVNFTDEEAKAIVDEAHRLGRRVAAHAIGSDGIAAALRAGVNTIEHGDGMTDSLIDVLVAKSVYWVPTVTVSRYVAGPRGGPWGPMVEHQRQAMARALKKGVKIVLGTDVGGFPWTELNQAKEFEYRSEEHTSELQSRLHLVCRLLLEKKKHQKYQPSPDSPFHLLPTGLVHRNSSSDLHPFRRNASNG